jgi:3-deoxy-D-manno-octulosonic-acid transferase
MFNDKTVNLERFFKSRIMVLLYDAGIYLYYFFVLIASLFNRKAKLWIDGKRGLFTRMKVEMQGVERLAWFHASSLGEFEQGRPVMEALRKSDPECKILLTFFSPSGYEVRKNYPGADYIYHMPLDTPRNARRFLEIIKPELVVFIKYEFWYHFLTQTKKTGAKLILISAIFRPGQLFFRWYGGWYRKMLRCFDYIFVQDEYSLDLLMNISIEHVRIAGDTRFDRVVQIAAEAKQNIVVQQFASGRFTYIFGSTWEKDEELIVEFINCCKLDVCYIIAPHEIHPFNIKNLVSKIEKKTILYSEAKRSELNEARVLIIDNIGMLSSLYRYGQLAYIGGGFGKGIHNILEAAVYGIPVVFGPNHKKFREAVELVREEGGFAVNNFNELKEILGRLREKKDKLSDASQKTLAFIKKNTGATETILSFLKRTN